MVGTIRCPKYFGYFSSRLAAQVPTVAPNVQEYGPPATVKVPEGGPPCRQTRVTITGLSDKQWRLSVLEFQESHGKSWKIMENIRATAMVTDTKRKPSCWLAQLSERTIEVRLLR